MSASSPKPATRRSRSVAAVLRACEFIDRAPQPPRLEDLAKRASVSASHLHREFKKLLGVTPREYADGKRIKRLQSALLAGEPVADAIFGAGYGSGSRVYEDSRAVLGMTPARYRDGGPGETIHYGIVDSELGRVLVAATDAGVCCIEFGDSDRHLREQLAARFPSARLRADDSELGAWTREIIQFIKKPFQNIDIPLDIRGTAFQRQVWQALRRIPPGQTVSYSALAQAVGKPRGARAVAAACAANKLALAVPCHRVVRSDGSVSGYRWGESRKRELLARERAASSRTPKRGQ